MSARSNGAVARILAGQAQTLIVICEELLADGVSIASVQALAQAGSAALDLIQTAQDLDPVRSDHGAGSLGVETLRDRATALVKRGL